MRTDLRESDDFARNVAGVPGDRDLPDDVREHAYHADAKVFMNTLRHCTVAVARRSFLPAMARCLMK